MRRLDSLPAPIVVCAPLDHPAVLADVFPDDLISACALCDQAVRVRPHAPAGSRVCLCCFIVNAPPGHFELIVTAQTLEDLAMLAVPEES